jgi:hypothetical protein
MYFQYKHKRMPEVDKLWVIAVISNPARYRSRYELYRKFESFCQKSGANLFTVELAFGDRPFELTQDEDPDDLQLRTYDEIWHKENMINLAIQRLPLDWKYVAWIDADIEFMRQDWLEEIVHQLQHYHVIQLFQNAVDLGPNGEVIKTHDGFAWSYVNRRPLPNARYNYPHWHPGYAWAARREAINDLGGLMDFAILGSADHHMAWALVNKVEQFAPKQISPAYKRKLLTWQERANRHIRQNIGYMPGTIYHHWHGRKKDRKYVERWQILLKHGYDPDQDLQRDWQGLYRLSDRGLRMRADLREYFHIRNEDSNEL